MLRENSRLRELHVAVGCPNYLDSKGSFLIYILKANGDGNLTVAGQVRRINPINRKRLTDRLETVNDEAGYGLPQEVPKLLILPESYYGQIKAEVAARSAPITLNKYKAEPVGSRN